MAENTDSSGQQDRSPSYPLVSLETALKRLTAFEAHFKRSTPRPEKVRDAWGIKAKAYADRTLAALRYFGLINYKGFGKERLIVVSDEGRKYLRAQQVETKRAVVKAAALRPNQIAKFWKEWGDDRPADAACLDELMINHGFSEAGASKFMAVYDATITFAGLSSSDKMPESDEEIDGDGDENNGNDDPPPPTIKVGDYIQWTSGGVDQFKPARRVVSVSADGSHVQVHGSPGGVPMSEATVVDPPAPPSPATLRVKSGQTDPVDTENDINVYLTGNRLQITADVDGKGLITLKKVLDQYEEILKLLSQPIENFKRPETE